MAKRMAALVLAWMILWASPAGAQAGPVWPCEVTVSIQTGPWRAAALGAVRQVDAATVMSWRVVEVDALVTIGWGPTETGGDAWMSGTATDMVAAVVTIDETTPNRSVMTGFLHELGHVAGIDHNDSERSVMNATDVQWRRYQPDDLAALADIGCRG